MRTAPGILASWHLTRLLVLLMLYACRAVELDGTEWSFGGCAAGRYIALREQ